MKVLVVGDTHGDTRWLGSVISKAHDAGISTILQVGDFGYWEHTEWGVMFLDETERALSRLGMDLWWIDGNHENHTMLRSKYPPRCDGLCEVRPHVFYVPRGHRWEWDGVTFLGLGGAYSVDQWHRTEGRSWWPEETITEGDVIRAAAGGRVDVMVSHDCPWGVDCMGFETVGDKDSYPESAVNRKRLRAVVDVVRPKILFHGHYHHRHSSLLEGRDYATRIEGLGRDGDPSCAAVLDLSTWQTQA